MVLIERSPDNKDCTSSVLTNKSIVPCTYSKFNAEDEHHLNGNKTALGCNVCNSDVMCGFLE